MNSFKRIVVVAAFLLAIAAVFWAFQRLRYAESETAGPSKNKSSGENGATSPVEDYLLFIDAAMNKDAGDRELIGEGLRKLAGAVGHLNLGTLDLQVSLRVAAEHVALNPAAASTSEAVRNSLVAAAEAIDMEHDGAGGLRKLAISLQPDRSLAPQHATLLEFFRMAAVAIKRAAAA